MAGLLPAAARSENVFPEHSATGWGDVPLPQLPPLVFFSLLFLASSYSYSASGGGLRR